MAWQQARVGVSAQDDQLLIHDLESGELIATHDLCKAKGRMVKNNNHYRDHAQRITDLERGIDAILPDDRCNPVPVAQAYFATYLQGPAGRCTGPAHGPCAG